MFYGWTELRSHYFVHPLCFDVNWSRNREGVFYYRTESVKPVHYYEIVPTCTQMRRRTQSQFRHRRRSFSLRLYFITISLDLATDYSHSVSHAVSIGRCNCEDLQTLIYKVPQCTEGREPSLLQQNTVHPIHTDILMWLNACAWCRSTLRLSVIAKCCCWISRLLYARQITSVLSSYI